MRCEMSQCKNKAKIKVSMSSGTAYCYCFKHGLSFVRAQIKQLSAYDFAIYIQRPPGPSEKREIPEGVRPYVTTPEDRAMTQEERQKEWDW